jgi:hypothetical protein
MQYMLLIYDREQVWSDMSDEEQGRIYAEYGAFTNDVREKGAYVSAGQLQPSSTATSVRVQDGEQVVTDGPFAETKEQLGGYYLIEAESVDEAIEWAAKIPSARYGTIEVRPVVQMRAGATAG